MAAIRRHLPARKLATALLAHVFAQLTPVFWRQIAPARRAAVFTPNLAVLLPLLSHLLAHLPAFIRRQIAPETLRPDAGRRHQQAQQQDQA